MVSRQEPASTAAVAVFDAVVSSLILAAETPAAARELWHFKIAAKRVLERTSARDINSVAAIQLAELRARYLIDAEVSA